MTNVYRPVGAVHSNMEASMTIGARARPLQAGGQLREEFVLLDRQEVGCG